MSPNTTTPAGHFTILYFAAATNHTSKDSDHLPAPLPLGKLFATLEERYPGMRAKVLNSSAVTLNLDYVDIEDQAETVIMEGDEVAIIPPVSSG